MIVSFFFKNVEKISTKLVTNHKNKNYLLQFAFDIIKIDKLFRLSILLIIFVKSWLVRWLKKLNFFQYKDNVKNFKVCFKF